MANHQKINRKDLKNTAPGLPDSRLLERLFFRLLPIQILMLLVGNVNGLVTSFFAGNYVNSAAMSAVGLYSPVNMLFSAISLMFVGGSQILCGKYMGRNEAGNAQKVFSWDIVIVSVVSIVGFIVLFFGVLTGLTGHFASDPEVLGMLNQYITGMAIGLPALMLSQQMSSFLALENQTARTTAASVACVGITTFSTFLLVKVFSLQALGLSLAVSLGNWAFFLIQAAYFLGKHSTLKLSLRLSGNREWLAILRTGYSGALKDIYVSIRGIIINALIVHYLGAAGLSSYTASDSVLRLFWSIPVGMGAVSRMLLSISIGEEDRKSLADVSRIVLYRCVPVMCCVSALIFLCAQPFTRLFFRDVTDPVYHITVMSFRIIPFCMPLSVISMNFINYAQASGKKLLVNILSLVDGIAAVALFTALLMPSSGMNGLYIANILNGVSCVLVIILYSWGVRKKFPSDMEQLMVIPDDFGVEAENRIDISVRDMDSVMTISNNVVSFCQEHGVDSRRANLSGLFLEEMAGNVLMYGFKRRSIKNYVDIRVIIKSTAHSGEDISGKGIRTDSLSAHGLSSGSIDAGSKYADGLSAHGLSSDGIDADGLNVHSLSSDGIDADGLSAHSLSSDGIDIILRIKDNGTPFNPAERLKMMSPESHDENIGIHMVYGTAKDIQYQNMLGLNVLTIRI